MLRELAEDWLELWRETSWFMRVLLIAVTPTYVVSWLLAEFFDTGV